MQELILFPTKRNLSKGVAYGVGAVALSVYLYFIAGNDIEFQAFAGIAFLGGLWMIAKSALGLSHPKPVFAADGTGFSVKGKAKRPWSDFRGVSIYTARSGLVSVGRFVRVKVGKSFLGGHIQIGATEMSGSAEEMVYQIGSFATKMQGAMNAERYKVPPVDQMSARPQPVKRPARAKVTQSFASPSSRPAATRVQDMGAGPVQSQPTLGERLFGRKNVI